VRYGSLPKFAVPFISAHRLPLYTMSRVCQVTGKKRVVGNNVSHANNKTKRAFRPNLQKKSFFLAEENRWVTLKLTTSAIKTIAKNGLSAVLKEAAIKTGLKV